MPVRQAMRQTIAQCRWQLVRAEFAQHRIKSWRYRAKPASSSRKRRRHSTTFRLDPGVVYALQTGVVRGSEPIAPAFASRAERDDGSRHARARHRSSQRRGQETRESEFERGQHLCAIARACQRRGRARRTARASRRPPVGEQSRLVGRKIRRRPRACRTGISGTLKQRPQTLDQIAADGSQQHTQQRLFIGTRLHHCRARNPACTRRPLALWMQQPRQCQHSTGNAASRDGSPLVQDVRETRRDQHSKRHQPAADDVDFDQRAVEKAVGEEIDPFGQVREAAARTASGRGSHRDWWHACAGGRRPSGGSGQFIGDDSVGLGERRGLDRLDDAPRRANLAVGFPGAPTQQHGGQSEHGELRTEMP